jgi:uncharacterized protein YjaZ
MTEALKFVPGYRGVAQYIAQAQADSVANFEKLWQEYAVAPYWAEWAAGQFNEERTRQQFASPLVDLDDLAVEVDLLARADIEPQIAEAYQQITAALPSPLPCRAVCLYPLDPRNTWVREKQNGVLGTCVGDNILLQINPLAEDWLPWAAYVLAHEYHHTVWGYNYFAVLRHTGMDLLTGLLVDGQADSFAQRLYPNLCPSWIDALTPPQEAEQWGRMQEHLASGDGSIYARFMFGEDASGTPPHTGYTIGYRIVQAYFARHPQTSVVDLMNIDSHVLLAESGYHPAS